MQLIHNDYESSSANLSLTKENKEKYYHNNNRKSAIDRTIQLGYSLISKGVTGIDNNQRLSNYT